MGLRQTASPAVEPVTLAEAKAHLRVTHTDDDAYITGLISTARSFCEADAMRAIATQSWLLSLDAFPLAPGSIRIDFGPVESITSIKYDDANGLEQTIAAVNYELDGQSNPAWVTPISTGWPSTLTATNAVRVAYVAGWGGLIPPDLKHAILLMIGEFYESREASSERPYTKLPIAVDRLLWNYRTFL